MGNFDAQMNWDMCFSVGEPWGSMDLANVRWRTPVGSMPMPITCKWSGPKAEEYSKIVDEIGTLPLGDPKIDDLFLQATRSSWKNTCNSDHPGQKIIPFDTTYWTGWPTADNDYIHPPTWWRSFHVILRGLTATGAQ